MTDTCNLNPDNKYHDFECCEWTRGVDTLLSRYDDDRYEVTNLILQNPNKLVSTIWSSSGPLAIDNECRCQMGSGEIRSPFACAQCKNLRRLIDFRYGGIEKPFLLQCGNSAGKMLIVSSVNITKPFLRWDEQAAYQAKLFVQQYNSLRSCGTPDISNLECITGDTFTIRTLILWMLYRILSEQGLSQHIPKLHTSFVCRGVGYSVYDTPTIGPLSSIKNLTVCRIRSIITQLIVLLLELSKLNYSNGMPWIDSLSFNNEPISYMYDNVHVQGDLTLQIFDMWNSSATLGGVHYFPENIKTSTHLDRGMFIPEIATKIVSMAHCHDVGGINPNNNVVCPATVNTCPDDKTYNLCKPQNVTLFRLTNSTVEIFNAMRHIGFPLYIGSFDLYCFITALMCNENIYKIIVNDQRLYRLWSMMWLIEDIPGIEERIKYYHEIGVNDRQTPINVIRGSWLRCDVVPYMWNLIKNGW